MANDYMETASYRLVPPVDLVGLLGEYYAFAMPEHWPGIIRQVWQRKWKTPDEDKTIPIGKVNAAIRAAMPEVLDTGYRLDPRSASSSILARTPADSAMLKRIYQAFLIELLGDSRDFQQLRSACEALDIDAHTGDWTRVTPDPGWIGRSTAGTADLHPTLYRIIPEVVAERILRQGKYDGTLAFSQVACDDGAELMSWPPLKYEASNRHDEPTAWYYSAVIRIQLRTVPFDPAPKLHLSVGIRRWVSGKLFIPPRKSVSVYLRPSVPTDEQGPVPRFAVPALRWDPERRQTVWRGGGPAQILGRLEITNRFPDIATLVTDADSRIRSQTGIQAGIVHQASMGGHGIATGVMPDERRRLLSWAANALSEHFEPAAVLELASLGRTKPVSPFDSHKKKPDELREPKAPATDDDEEEGQTYQEARKQYESDFAEWEKRLAAAEAANELVDATNAGRRREFLIHAMDEQELRVDLLASTDRIRTALLHAIATWLGLDPQPVTGELGQYLFTENRLKVRVTIHDSGALTADLGRLGETPKRGSEHEAATGQRSAEVAAFLGGQPLRSELVLVEIAERDSYRKTRTADPYRAIRVGAAMAGRVTQFITTGGKDEELPHRAMAAWVDGLRQLGIRLLPNHSAKLAVPRDLDQVAFWLVRRNTTAESYYPVFTPVALLIRAGQRRIQARTNDTDGWKTYPELLCELACSPPRDDKLKFEGPQREALAQLVRTTLQKLRGRPTLILTDATNLRSRWRWLTDEVLEPDRFSTGDGDVKALTSQGSKFRMIRVRSDAGRSETPAWWARKDAASTKPAGFTTGLWKHAGAGPDNRVFYSLVDKNNKLNSLPTATAKFTGFDYNGRKPAQPHKAAPVPRLLEVTVAGLAPSDQREHAEDWAMFVHQQRYCPEHADGLALPYALAMAQRTTQYALGHEDDEEAVELTEESPGDGGEQFEQLPLF